METIILLPFSGTPATDGFFYPCNGNVFVNKPGIEVSQSGFYGYCNPLFYPFSTHWKCVFDTYPSFWLIKTGLLASGNNFFSNLRYSCLFLPSVNLFLQHIHYSGQWKLIFWLVETILLQFLNYQLYWKQLFHLVEIYFK